MPMPTRGLTEATTAFVGLGANLADPRKQVDQALAALERLPDCRLLARSRCYRTRPVGPQDQPAFVNAVAALETQLNPLGLLAALQAIEQAQGRRRDGERWGPRTLDLDLLLFGDQRLQLPTLQVPHPRMAERAFVLVPLCDLLPRLGLLSETFEIPGAGRLEACLARLDLDVAGVEPL